MTQGQDDPAGTPAGTATGSATGTAAGPAPSRYDARSPGLQARSRERRDDILREAAALVAAQGYDGLKMRELARRCSMPIASLYHYFPSSGAVLRALAEAHLDAIGARLAETIASEDLAAAQGAEALAAIGRIIRKMAAFLRAMPASAAIWDALRAVPELRQVDIADSVLVARDLEPYLRPLCPRVPPERLGDFALVLLEAVQSNLLMQIDAPQERHEALTEALVMLVTSIFEGQMRRPG